jgi:hypothetical protein
MFRARRHCDLRPAVSLEMTELFVYTYDSLKVGQAPHPEFTKGDWVGGGTTP